MTFAVIWLCYVAVVVVLVLWFLPLPN